MKVWLVEYMEEGDNHSTLVRICDSYDKAKAYVKRQYECARAYHVDKEYNTITELKVYHRETNDQFVWHENNEMFTYFISCEEVM